MTAADASTEPVFPRTLLDALRRWPGRTAFEHRGRTVSYGELLGLVGELVEAMRAAGLGRGRGVALLTGITVEGFAANVAAHALGCRVVGLRPGWSPPQLAGALRRGVDVVLGDPTTLTPDLVAAAQDAGLDTTLSLGTHSGAADLLASARLDGAGKTAGGPPVEVEAQPGDIARVNFTSGSTGAPKGCARTYRTFSLMYQPDRWAPDLARLVGCFGRFLVHQSFSHPVMLTFAGRSLVTGGTVVLAGEPRPDLVQAIERHGITGVVMPVPFLHRLLADLRERPRDLASLRALVVTGSPASPSLLADATGQLGPIVWQGYGQAESGMISLLTPEDIAGSQSALSSVGRVLPEVDVEIRDPDGGHVLAPGQSGEICVRSPHAMAGYWDDPQQTAEVLRDGWLHTGDLGRLDEAGFLHLTGRSRDVIMVDAEVCYAGAIEQALAGHPDVDQAYVVGVPDDRTGEAVHAFVVPTPDRPAPTPDVLSALVRAQLTPAHVPRTITTLPEVPTTPTGKPDKPALTTLVPTTP